MRLYSLLFLFMIFCGCFVVSMELPSQISWNNLPATVIMPIIGTLQPSDKQALCLVNKQLSLLASKKNIDNLLQWPCVLSKKYHLNLMIQYAKINNEKLMALAIKSAPLCDHHDALEIIFYFLTEKDYILANYLSLYRNDHYDEYLQALLPMIMAVYQADQGLYNHYKNKFTIKSGLHGNFSVLQAAVYYNHLPLVKLFLAQEKNGIINFYTTEEDMFEYTPLHIAVGKNDRDMVKLLLTHEKTMINAVARNNITPLCVAIGSRYYDLAITLLNAGADTNIQTAQAEKEGGFLHFAVLNGQLKLIVSLLRNGIALNKQDQNGDTALMISVTCNNTFFSLAKLKKDMTKEKNAYDCPFFKITELLLSSGADPNIYNVFGEMPLISALRIQNIPMVKLLLRYGASPTKKNLKGENAYFCALSNEEKTLLKKSQESKKSKKPENCIIS